MSLQEKPQSAEVTDLMKSFPPLPDKIVNHENQLFGPYNRWSFQNILRLNNTADVWRGDGPVNQLEYNICDLSKVTYQNRAGNQFTFEEMVEQSYTDGIVVLHNGKIIFEKYLNGMKPNTLHAWASGSKSITGVLAAMLANEGLFDIDECVSAYLPELKDSGFRDATIRQLMDMTTAVTFPKKDFDPVTESVESGFAMGWKSRPNGYTGPNTTYEFLPLMKKEGEHGSRFTYLTVNTDVLAWLIKRLENKTLAEIMYERIWSKIGAERDAFCIVDSASAELAGSGLITTLRDMARFGQMMLQQGKFHGQQIIPTKVIEEIESGADPSAFANGPAAGPTNEGWSYHNQWWITHNLHGAYLGLGYGGQILYIDPAAKMVVAKMSSFPTPTLAGNEFYGAMAAIPALAKYLMR